MFKGTKNICEKEGLGSIIAITVGDVLNKGRNFIIVATAEGLCHIYSVEGGMEDPLRSIVKLRVPHNVSSMLVADIDGDGANELMIGTTGHAVYIFEIISTPPTSAEVTATAARAADEALPSSQAEPGWKLNLKKEFLFNGQIESLAAIPFKAGETGVALAVGILGESQDYSHLEYSTVIDGEAYPHLIEVSDLDKEEQDLALLQLQLQQQAHQQHHQQQQQQQQERIDVDFHRKTEIVALPKNSQSNSSMYVVSSFNGYVALQKHEGDRRSAPVTMWRKSITNVPLLTSVVASVIEEKSDYGNIVVCSWDGTTHIYDVEGNSLRFVFGHSIRAFAAGKYRITEGEEPSTCFMYLTFHDKIVIYYNIRIPRMHTCTMVDVLEDEVLAAYRSLTGSSTTVPTLKERKLLLRYCMSASLDDLEALKKGLAERPKRTNTQEDEKSSNSSRNN